MKKLFALLLLALPLVTNSQPIKQPAGETGKNNVPSKDWLISGKNHFSEVHTSKSGKNLTLSNGLLQRSFVLQPNAACIDFKNLTTGEQLLRAVKPEATIVINGLIYNIGGLYGQNQNAYLLNEWPDSMQANNRDFQYESYSIANIPPYLNWKTRSWLSNKKSPEGKMLTFTYRSQLPQMNGIAITVNYELYNGIPLICKWLGVVNRAGKSIRINQVVNEILATPEEESAVEGSTGKMLKPHGLYIESNFCYNNSMTARLSDQTTHWETDSAYTSQVSYEFKTPCLLKVYPDKGVGIDLSPGESFTSIRTFELLLDGYDRERNGLAQKRMYRTVAPWSTANPIFMHLISNDPLKIKAAVDQCAATGYEGIILSFGSGMNLEDTSGKNIQKAKALADYAHNKGILLGGYSLLAAGRSARKMMLSAPSPAKPGGAFFWQCSMFWK